MFISLNRKIIYSILLLFLITSLIFVYTFYWIYGNQIQEEQRHNIQRNNQYIELLARNISLSQELRRLIKQYPQITVEPAIQGLIGSDSAERQHIELLDSEKKRIAEITQNFNLRYEAVNQSIHLFGASAVLIILSIILLALLMTRWVLRPINRISLVSSEVMRGNLSARISSEKRPRFRDEFDYLILTFNNMLDTLEQVISEVQEQEAFLQALIDSIPDGIRVVDQDYNIVVANKAYYKQIGAEHKKCRKCYQASQNREQPCQPETTRCPLHEIMTSGQKHVNVIQQFCSHPDRPLSINAAPLVYKGRGEFVVESIRDLSGDINFSHQQKLSSLGFLSSSVAHEIKNHLGALRIILEHLIDKYYADKDDSEEKKNLLLIYNELVDCIEVPERLLKLSRASTDNTRKIDLIASLKDVVSLLDYEAKSHGISIEFTPPKTPLYITGNEADFKMAAINLILNAIKATSANGLISVHVKYSKEHRVIIDFTDTGCGIAPQNLNRIFDPFFSDGHDDTHKGSGLGLSIVKSIVEKSGGQISVSSKLGHGSCFSLSFPAIKRVAN